jgi:hypothetical protein
MKDLKKKFKLMNIFLEIIETLKILLKWSII